MVVIVNQFHEFFDTTAISNAYRLLIIVRKYLGPKGNNFHPNEADLKLTN